MYFSPPRTFLILSDSGVPETPHSPAPLPIGMRAGQRGVCGWCKLMFVVVYADTTMCRHTYPYAAGAMRYSPKCVEWGFSEVEEGKE